MTVEKDLEGRVALVTGAARNLGRGIAEMLARRAARVVVHHHSAGSLADAESTAQTIRDLGAESHVVAADLADPVQVENLAAETLRRFGRMDILVNNAGLIVKKPFAEIENEDFERAFAINARAPFLLMRAAARHMRNGGRIVNIGTSILGCSFPFYSVYAASKAAMEHLTRGLSKELAEREITVNTIAPGALDTPFFFAAETPESANQIKMFTGGLGKVEDVVPTVAHLVSASARWLSGQTLFVNGGFVTR